MQMYSMYVEYLMGAHEKTYHSLHFNDPEVICVFGQFFSAKRATFVYNRKELSNLLTWSNTVPRARYVNLCPILCDTVLHWCIDCWKNLLILLYSVMCHVCVCTWIKITHMLHLNINV